MISQSQGGLGMFHVFSPSWTDWHLCQEFSRTISYQCNFNMFTLQGISLNEQDAAITVTDSQEKPEELPIQSKHRRGHKRRKGFPFHKRDGGLHKRTHGFHKRNHGDRKREYPVNNGEKLKLRSNPKNLKKLMKLIKRAEHMRMRQNREQHKKDITP